jgi:hypothetical protein
MKQPKPELAAHVSVVETGDGMVLLDQRRGRYWQLNGTGARVVRTLRDGGDPEQAVHELVRAHPAAAHRIAADVAALVRALTAAKVITR